MSVSQSVPFLIEWQYRGRRKIYSRPCAAARFVSRLRAVTWLPLLHARSCTALFFLRTRKCQLLGVSRQAPLRGQKHRSASNPFQVSTWSTAASEMCYSWSASYLVFFSVLRVDLSKIFLVVLQLWKSNLKISGGSGKLSQAGIVRQLLHGG